MTIFTELQDEKTPYSDGGAAYTLTVDDGDSHEGGAGHEFLAGVKKIIASKADMEELQIEASSKLKDLAVDSLVNAEIILALEEEYALDSISEKEAESLVTVADAAALVAAKKREKDAATASVARGA